MPMLSGALLYLCNWFKYYRICAKTSYKICLRCLRLTLLLHLNLPTLSYHRFREDMIMTYNILHNNVDLNPNEFFQFYSYSITRGHDYYKIYKPHAQRLVRSNNFSIRVINYWNNLPPSIVNAPSTNVFKNNLDSYFNGFTVYR